MSDIQELIQDIFAAGPTGVILRIVIILIIAFVAQWIGGRAIRRSVLAVTSRAPKRRAGQLRGVDDDELATTLMEDRQGQRAHALGSLAKNALTIIIWVIAVMMILSTLGVNIAPIIASGAVISAVLGFGAQTYIADYLNGISMIFEDQMGIGDTVELGGIVLGEVEETALRYTRIRDFWGVVWYVRNGQIQSVANQSQGWTYSLIEIPVPYDEDLTKVQQVVDAVGKEMGEDPQYNGVLLGAPYYSNVTELTATSVVVRVNTKIVPNGNQWYAGRVIRQRMKEGLDAAGIRIPYDGIQVRTFQAGVQEVPPKPPGDSGGSTPQATGEQLNADENPGQARP
ncbi:MAG: mechanosensitive ion channel family protein [Candidatus Nanopelagicales bacterium]|jgi:small conductance mechanosensitive channel|nr:mechanosensitive ion channel family protein [Actinomycetota bacterium]NDA50600.1 mechanosensitive ion channel family protein [Actinomycetota bacterium]NDA59314.1 mechanosensitive ion channel family protein [Actinomycetota bacterium]NDG95705.1 mechanosensitive ion channel family protein [Actinomycetota bacterium]NDH14193.1 mechanosensitive ion channel family protein [Actinomycetota bacterium]